MAEGEKASEHSQILPPMTDQAAESLPDAAVGELREPKSDPLPWLSGRVAVLIGLLLTATILYIGSFALLLHRDKPVVELFFGAPRSEPALDLTLNVLSLDPVREVINIRIEVARPSDSRWWQTLKDADVRDFVIRVDDRYLTFQMPVERGGARVLEIGLSGSISRYPLDRYSGFLSVSVSKKGSEAPQPVRLTAWPLVSNWDVEVRRSGQASENPARVDLNIQVNRPTSFIVMAFAFYAAMALIGLSGLTIGTLVFLRVRPVEAGMTSALGAMIFSIPALRGIMPGAPPLGVRADALILVWVQMAVILGLTLFVMAWVTKR